MELSSVHNHDVTVAVNYEVPRLISYFVAYVRTNYSHEKKNCKIKKTHAYVMKLWNVNIHDAPLVVNYMGTLLLAWFNFNPSMDK